MSVCKSQTRSHEGCNKHWTYGFNTLWIARKSSGIPTHTSTSKCIVVVNYEGSVVIALSDWQIQLHVLSSSIYESDIWNFGFYISKWNF